jgi:hypothetical protein
MGLNRSPNGEKQQRPVKGLRYGIYDYPLLVYSKFIGGLTSELCDILDLKDNKELYISNDAVIFTNDSVILFKFVRFRIINESMQMDLVYGHAKDQHFDLLMDILSKADDIKQILFRYIFIINRAVGRFNPNITAKYIEFIEKGVKDLSINNPVSQRFLINCEHYKDDVILKHKNYALSIQFYLKNNMLCYDISYLYGASSDEDGKVIKFREITTIDKNALIKPDFLHAFLLNLYFYGDIDHEMVKSVDDFQFMDNSIIIPEDYNPLITTADEWIGETIVNMSSISTKSYNLDTIASSDDIDIYEDEEEVEDNGYE